MATDPKPSSNVDAAGSLLAQITAPRKAIRTAYADVNLGPAASRIGNRQGLGEKGPWQATVRYALGDLAAAARRTTPQEVPSTYPVLPQMQASREKPATREIMFEIDKAAPLSSRLTSAFEQAVAQSALAEIHLFDAQGLAVLERKSAYDSQWLGALAAAQAGLMRRAFEWLGAPTLNSNQLHLDGNHVLYSRRLESGYLLTVIAAPNADVANLTTQVEKALATILPGAPR